MIAFFRPLPGSPSVDDGAYLQAIQWEADAPDPLVKAARRGDAAVFCREWRKRVGAAGAKSRLETGAGLGWPSFWSLGAFEENDRTTQLARILEEIGSTPKRSAAKIGTRAKSAKSTNGTSNGRKMTAAGDSVSRRHGELLDWLEQIGREDSVEPSELAMLFDLLIHAGPQLPAELLWRAWRVALTAAVQLSQQPSPLPLSQRERGEAADAGPVRLSCDQRLLIEGELPWLAGLLFPSVRGANDFARSGQQVLERELLTRTDAAGTPQAELLDRLLLWLAPLVRSAAFSKHFRIRLWSGEAEERFRKLIKTVVPLCDAEGRIAMGNGSSRHVVALLAAASQLAGWKKNAPLLKYVLSLGSNGKNGSWKSDVQSAVAASQGALKSYKKFLPPANQSDWARMACLRNHWAQDADLLVVAHHRDKPQIDLRALGTPLLSGVWDLDVRIDGEPLVFTADWSCICWHSDDDADYLELQAKFAAGLRIERQLLLSRQDRFVLLADSVSGARGAKVELTSRLPLAAGVIAEADVPTRECRLRAPRRRSVDFNPRELPARGIEFQPRATLRPRVGSNPRYVTTRVFPLALPQDRVLSTAGGFAAVANGLELTQAAIGGLYAPLILDWEPRRRRTDADWRSLTVTEHAKIVKSDTAAGHRLRIGGHHLLVYRSLSQAAESRAVLGLHTVYESVIGKLDADGDLKSIIQVEA